MNADNLKRLGCLFRELADELETAIPDQPPKQENHPVKLLDYCPKTMADLPAWFASLTKDQLHAVWPSAITSCAAEESYSIRDLSMAMRAVRDWPNGPIIEVSVAAPGKAIAHKRRKISDQELIEIANQHAPAVGDRFFFKDAYAGWAPSVRARAVERLRSSGHWHCDIEPLEGSPRGAWVAHRTAVA